MLAPNKRGHAWLYRLATGQTLVRNGPVWFFGSTRILLSYERAHIITTFQNE